MLFCCVDKASKDKPYPLLGGEKLLYVALERYSKRMVRKPDGLREAVWCPGQDFQAITKSLYTLIVHAISIYRVPSSDSG
jgi:hypothetical protein